MQHYAGVYLLQNYSTCFGCGHVARKGRRGERIGSWWGNRRERDRWGDLGVDGWIIVVIVGWISRR